MDRRIMYGVAAKAVAGAAVVLSMSAMGWAQGSAVTGRKAVSDAQVEANVLKALAGASDLAGQSITTTTVYGVVTLSGSVQTEGQRTEAETLVSHTSGVQKVVDEMTLASQTPSGAATSSGSASAEAGAASLPGADASAGTQQEAQVQAAPQYGSDAQPVERGSNQAQGPNYGPGAPEYGRADGGIPAPPPDVYARQGAYPERRPDYGPRAGDDRRYSGQPGGEMVTIPSGAMIRIRINESLDSGRTEPGARFDGIVVNDVVADGAVAIPRGATVQGVVVDAKPSGVLKGRGELSLQLTEVTLAGRSYPLVSNVWNHHGGDKTTETVNKTAIGGGIGALFGAAAGGGAGAAIGAGIGGALGLGSSAASGNGQVYVASEGVLTFQLAQPATVATVSQEEMNRLGQGVPPGAQRALVRRRAYPYPVYGPVYRRYPYPYPVYVYPY